MKPTDSVERIVYTARFPAGLYDWMRSEIHGTEQSLNDLIVQAVADIRDCYGLPTAMVDALEDDRRALRLGHRAYVLHLLTRRYDQLMTNPPGFDAKRPRHSEITQLKSKR